MGRAGGASWWCGTSTTPPRVISNHLPEETRTANNNRLDAVRKKLQELIDPNLLLCNMCWFDCLTLTNTQESLFVECFNIPKMKLESRLKEQLQEGVDACLPLL